MQKDIKNSKLTPAQEKALSSHEVEAKKPKERKYLRKFKALIPLEEAILISDLPQRRSLLLAILEVTAKTGSEWVTAKEVVDEAVNPASKGFINFKTRYNFREDGMDSPETPNPIHRAKVIEILSFYDKKQFAEGLYEVR